MNLDRRIKKLEQNIETKEEPPSVAILGLDGRYHYAGKVYATREAFDAAVDKVFVGQPKTLGPDLILVKFYRLKSRES
jgi:hypothetical protein